MTRIVIVEDQDYPLIWFDPRTDLSCCDPLSPPYDCHECGHQFDVCPNCCVNDGLRDATDAYEIAPTAPTGWRLRLGDGPLRRLLMVLRRP